MTTISDSRTFFPAAGRAAAQSRQLFSSARTIAPGTALAGAIATVAFVIRYVPAMTTVSPMILAILIGIAFRNILGAPSITQPGIKFSLKYLLRVAIVLLGFQLTVAQIAAVGPRGLLIVAISLVATFGFTVWAGRALGVDRKLSELIAAGTSICGASAIVATNAVTDAHDEDVAYAIACVTVFGSVAMFAYPVLSRFLHLGSDAYGLWSGTSIHEIAQVVAASFQNGQRAGEIGTMVKLARVMMLAPVVFALNIKARFSPGTASDRTVKPPAPWFVIGFIALVGLNSIIVVPTETTKAITTVTAFLLSLALAAMGLETDVAKLYAKGIRPAILGALAFLFIASVSLTLIKLAG